MFLSLNWAFCRQLRAEDGPYLTDEELKVACWDNHG